MELEMYLGGWTLGVRGGGRIETESQTCSLSHLMVSGVSHRGGEDLRGRRTGSGGMGTGRGPQACPDSKVKEAHNSMFLPQPLL